MSNLKFHRGPLPPDFTLAFKPSIFNTDAFLQLQASRGWESFYVLDMAKKTADALIHVHVQGETATSPLRAPFGAIESKAGINSQVVFDFLGYVERELQKEGVRKISIKCPPREYEPALIALVETFLHNRGYRVASAEVGAVINVDANAFTSRLAHSESLRLNQAEKAGLKFESVPVTALDSVFEFIAMCHREKGYQLTISLEQIQTMAQKFPDRYILSTVVEKGLLVAAAISVRVNDDVLYNFMVNHDKRFNSLSPPVLLMEGLYDCCQRNGIRIFDLGTSALDGNPNFPLLDFKLRMGARTTSKLVFHKDLL